MSRPKKREKFTNGLLDALEFVSAAQGAETLAPYQKFCKIENNWVIATDGVLTIGQKIKEDLVACPDTINLIAILKQCKQELSITQTNDTELIIRSGKITANIECYPDPQVIPISYPDEIWGIIDNRLKDAFQACAPLTDNKSQEIVLSSILLNDTSCISTDTSIIFEYWHGINLPILVIPANSARAVARTKKELAKFGFSENSATFYFTDGSFIKTQLLRNTLPDYSLVLNTPHNALPIPEGFFEGVNNIKHFTKSTGNLIYIKDSVIYSSRSLHKGVKVEIEGIEKNQIISVKHLQMLQKFVTRMDFKNERGKVVFFGENIRGVIAGRSDI